MNKYDNTKLTVVHSLEGRIRLRLERSIRNPEIIIREMSAKKEIKKIEYNRITMGVLIEFDPSLSDFEGIVYNFCAKYANDLGTKRLTLSYTVCKKYFMGYSAYLSLAFIAGDLLMGAIYPTASTAINGAGNVISATGMVNSIETYRKILRWFTLGTTVGAIIEHGYKEINDRGTFDPEVMSVMYLINQVGKENKFAPAIAWAITFGRHLLNTKNSYVELDIVKKGNDTKVIPKNVEKGYLNKFLNRCLESYHRVGPKVV